MYKTQFLASEIKRRKNARQKYQRETGKPMAETPIKFIDNYGRMSTHYAGNFQQDLHLVPHNELVRIYNEARHMPQIESRGGGLEL